jgi:hypothetical protein
MQKQKRGVYSCRRFTRILESEHIISAWLIWNFFHPTVPQKIRHVYCPADCVGLSIIEKSKEWKVDLTGHGCRSAALLDGQ